MADDLRPTSAGAEMGAAAPPAASGSPIPRVGAAIDGDDQFVSLYRRFRPGRFADLRGQDHVVRALQGAVRDGRVAHAYLFSGPHGTGKTSSARILARALNCAAPVGGEPCGTCASCVAIAQGTSLDVHELDAASNNGVDAMRDLIAHAALSTPGRWKVYIVDEVHMLSNAAANALLKTLEEPPGHVVFVLATTDPQKVPPTIRSRTQHFEFGLLGPETLTGLLRDVNASAGLSLDEADLSVAVRKARGSARDALSAMDQVAASGSADALRPEVDALVESVAEGDARGALVAVAALGDAGWGPQQLATELVDELRQTFLAALAPELCAAVGAERDRLAERSGRMGLARVVRAMEALGRAQVDMRDAPDPRAVLEVTLARLAHPELDETIEALLDRISRLEQGRGTGATAPMRPEAIAATGPGSVPRPVIEQPPPARSSASTPVPVAERPGLGALRRERAQSQAPAGAPSGRQAADPPPPQTSAPPEASGAPNAPLPPEASAAPNAPTPPEASAAPNGPPPPEASAPPETPPPAPTPPSVPSPPPARSPGRPAPDRDTVVEAWGDHVLRALPGRAKALFSPGRFVGMDGSVATFALPNAAHREAAEQRRDVVERALSSHFGTKLALRLIVDDAEDSPANGGAASRPEATRQPAGHAGADAAPVPEPDDGLDPGDEIDPDQPSGSAESAAQARLLQAFPGAEEVG